MDKYKKLPKNLINHKSLDLDRSVDSTTQEFSETITSEFVEVEDTIALNDAESVIMEDVSEKIFEIDNEIKLEVNEESSSTNTKNSVKDFWRRLKTEHVVDLQENRELEVLKEEKHMSLKRNVESMNESAVISSTMSVKGDVELDTSLVLNGKVYGNIKCNDLIEATFGSYIEGNVEAKSVKFTGSELKGNITIEDFLEANNQSKVLGNIIARRVEISGQVNGEINASDSIVLKNTAIVKGDLISASISIEAGAQLDGKVVTVNDSSRKSVE
jgi:cytoskeletal protein CcmA (bactofilin family)